MAQVVPGNPGLRNGGAEVFVLGGPHLEKLQENGYDGKYSIVEGYVRGRKMDLEEKATVRFETLTGRRKSG